MISRVIQGPRAIAAQQVRAMVCVQRTSVYPRPAWALWRMESAFYPTTIGPAPSGTMPQQPALRSVAIFVPPLNTTLSGRNRTRIYFIRIALSGAATFQTTMVL